MKSFLSIAAMLCCLAVQSQNPLLLKDVFPGGPGSGIQQIVKTSNYTFFNGDDDDPDSDRGLYRTDGTPGGTIKINLSYLPDPPPSANNYASTKADKLTALGNKVFFAGDNLTYYGEIWVSDGTQGGTIALERFQPTITSRRSTISDIISYNNEAFYSVRNTDNHLLLKKTNGTPGSMSLVYDFGVAPNGDALVTLFSVVNNILYFIKYDGGAVDQLWRSDGTTAGTYMLKDFTSARYVASNLMAAGTNFYIMLVEPGVGNVLWKSDGTAAGTVAVKTIGSSGNNNYPANLAVGNTLYFAGLSGTGMELWKTDGTSVGTLQVADVYPGPSSSNISNLTTFNNVIIFSGSVDATGTKLLKYDSTVSVLKDVNVAASPNGLSSFVLSGANKLLFPGSTAANGTELWETDGTTANTRLVADIRPGTIGSSPNLLTAGNPTLFVTDNGVTGQELFSYNSQLPANVISYNRFFVNDENTNGDVYTQTIGSNLNNGTAASPFRTINHAISVAQGGDTIYVDAGTYAENVVVNKPSLTLKGIQAGLAPGSALSRGTESIVYHTVNTLNANNQLIGNVIEVLSTNITIDGFTLDGDNPALAGGQMINGVDANAGVGIFNQQRLVNGFVAKNNIIRNCTRYGVFLIGNAAILTENNLLTQNTFDNISAGGGRAIACFNNAYANVTDNYITRSSVGVIYANHTVASTQPVTISGNNISSYANGIQIQMPTAPAMTVSNNTIETADLASWNSAGSTLNNIGDGILVAANGTGRLSLLTNTITNKRNGINSSFAQFTGGYVINGGSISNSLNVGAFIVAGTSPAISNLTLLNNPVGFDFSSDAAQLRPSFTNVTITGGTTGIRFYGNQLALLNNAITGVSFFNQSKEYILQTSNAFQNQTINASAARFEGLTPMQMSLAQLFATEDKLTHKIDFDGVGYFKLKPTEVFVTKNSFAATLPPVFGTPTFAPQINRAIGAAAAGDVVHVGEGIFTNQVIIDKALTLKGAGMGLTTIQMPPVPHIAAFTAPDFGSEYGVVQTTENISGDVNIEQLTVDGVNQTFANNAHGIIIQTGGKVADCEVKNMRNPIVNQTYQTGNGIFARYNGTTFKSLNFDGNKVSGFNFNGLLVFGSAYNVRMTNNEIDGTGGLSSMAINSLAFSGAVQSLQISNNTISGYTAFGIGLTGDVSAVINNNAITGTGNFTINNQTAMSPDATCNWFGTSNLIGITSKINGAVNFTPWLTNGTDTDAATGFQPSASACNGTLVVASIDVLTDVSCKDAADGSIQVSITNGQAPFTYAWSKDGLAGFSSLKDISNLTPGLYKLTVTDANSTTDTLSAEISEPDALVAIATGSSNICFGATAGTADVSASGGTQPYSYLWSNAATTDNISDLAAGVYSVTITDANGCTTAASYTVTQPAELLATATGVSTACSNSATVTAIGGTGTLSYLWSNGAVTSSINNIASGTYSVTVTDDNGCSAVASVTVTGAEAFNPSVQVNNVNCFGTMTGALTVTNVNGQAPFEYSIDGINYQTSNIFTGLAAGTYTVSVVDANGCAGFVNKTITQPPLLTVVLNNVQPTCGGASTGSITVTAAGGSGAYNYAWSGTGYTSTQRNIGNLAAGSYSLTVTDNNGCTTLLNVAVTSFNAITLTDVVSNIRCKAEANGSIDLTVTGGTGQGFTYAWTNGSTSQDLVNLGVGNFNVTITDIGSGCTVSKNYTITQPASLVSMSTTKTNATGCATLGTITITGSGGTAPYTYSKDGVNFAAANSFTNLYAGSYTVWIKDNNGCTRSTVVTITDNGSDQYESNNSKGQAKPIDIGTAVYARLAIANDAIDWFKITTPTGAAQYTVAINHDNIAYNFNLYAAGNNTPALAPVAATAGTKTYNLAGGTTYYISVTGALSYKCYTLSISPVLFSKTGLDSQPKTLINSETIIVSETLEAVVFPNPHRGNFSMQVQSPVNGRATIKLFSATGQQLAQKVVTMQRGAVNMVPFNAVKGGTIFYRVEMGNHVATGKIIGTN